MGQRHQKGGYATASNYVSTIVSVIESNDLHKYDQQVMQEMKAQGKSLVLNQIPYLPIIQTRKPPTRPTP